MITFFFYCAVSVHTRSSYWLRVTVAAPTQVFTEECQQDRSDSTDRYFCAIQAQEELFMWRVKSHFLARVEILDIIGICEPCDLQ